MRIPRPLRLLLVLPFAFILTGCISSYTLVKVNPTGAGTLEQTTLISPMMVGMMSGMAQSMGGEEGKKTKPPTVADLFKEEELRNAADNMGQGVRFVSSKPAKAEGREGVTAIYAFDDVTKLSVSQGMKAPGGGGSSAKVSNESPIVFAMTPGSGRRQGAEHHHARGQEGRDRQDKPAEAGRHARHEGHAARSARDDEVDVPGREDRHRRRSGRPVDQEQLAARDRVARHADGSRPRRVDGRSRPSWSRCRTSARARASRTRARCWATSRASSCPHRA